MYGGPKSSHDLEIVRDNEVLVSLRDQRPRKVNAASHEVPAPLSTLVRSSAQEQWPIPRLPREFSKLFHRHLEARQRPMSWNGPKVLWFVGFFDNE